CRKRQTSVADAPPSRIESKPNPTSAVEPATKPATSDAIPATAAHATDAEHQRIAALRSPLREVEAASTTTTMPSNTAGFLGLRRGSPSYRAAQDAGGDVGAERRHRSLSGVFLR